MPLSRERGEGGPADPRIKSGEEGEDRLQVEPGQDENAELGLHVKHEWVRSAADFRIRPIPGFRVSDRADATEAS
jgi:hypothetical protein